MLGGPRDPLRLPALVIVAMMMCAWPGSQTLAAGRPGGARSLAGTVWHSTRATTLSSGSYQEQSSPSALTAGSLTGNQHNGRCATLRRNYARSEACFARYRMRNRGLRPGAFQHCKQLKDPSTECGPR